LIPDQVYMLYPYLYLIIITYKSIIMMDVALVMICIIGNLYRKAKAVAHFTVEGILTVVHLVTRWNLLILKVGVPLVYRASKNISGLWL